jgi:hypothetical protein
MSNTNLPGEMGRKIKINCWGMAGFKLLSQVDKNEYKVSFDRLMLRSRMTIRLEK